MVGVPDEEYKELTRTKGSFYLAVKGKPPIRFEGHTDLLGNKNCTSPATWKMSAKHQIEAHYRTIPPIPPGDPSHETGEPEAEKTTRKKPRGPDDFHFFVR